MRGKYKNKKETKLNTDSADKECKNVLDDFVKYFLCLFATLIPFYCIFLTIKDYGFAGLFNCVGLFAIIFLLLLLCIFAMIFYDNKSQENKSKIYGIILYFILAISSTFVCFTQEFIATYYCENNVCKVITSSFFKDKQSNDMVITPETESIGMNIYLDAGSKTSMGISLFLFESLCYVNDINNKEKFNKANGSNIKLKSFHSIYCTAVVLLSFVFVIPSLYFIYHWKRKIFYLLFFILACRLLYIFLIL